MPDAILILVLVLACRAAAEGKGGSSIPFSANSELKTQNPELRTPDVFAVLSRRRVTIV